MRQFCFFSFLCFVFACNTTSKAPVVEHQAKVQTEATDPVKPKNIILLIGDGMGLTQITAGMFAQGNKTALEQFKHIGLHKPYASDKLITDSAAAATAFACGIKTFNGAIGVDADTMPVRTILEHAELLGLATGLVASSTIVHATPASFIAHNKSRRNYEAIAEDFLDTEVDIMIGGGKKFFDRRENDDKNLVDSLKARNYKVVDYTTDFSADLIDPEMNFCYLTADKDPLQYSQGRDYLIPASKAAIDYLKLKNETGFFLMIEGSQIDWGGHANLQDYVISEFKEFDKIIKHAIEWARVDGETLVIVTADHETGGMAIQNTSKMDSLDIAFTSTKHTGTMIPVFAFGPGAEEFNGIYENYQVHSKMKRVMGWLSK